MFFDANVLIYLNLGVEEVARFFEKLLTESRLYTNVLVLDEVLYVSWRRYGVKFEDTMRFLDDVVLPYVKVLNVGWEEYVKAKGYVGILKPSDALHVAVMLNNGIKTVVSEDRDFDRVGDVRRVWIR
ncbi:MAG: PIN domain nuclease [Candidatus Methanomethylicota archaeon]|uniref:Ribonuclease VapC n=1 Tax=Thermoproteota archaeon TaxID=2056631 RepID=A0A497EX49_9CREN|nr:MAG: PIN domain nuclease [Candidatus Verstraetearchaeota archaeon]